MKLAMHVSCIQLSTDGHDFTFLNHDGLAVEHFGNPRGALLKSQQDTGYPEWGSCDCRKILVSYLRISHDHFIPHPKQFTIPNHCTNFMK
jgi:hypothetical protein